MLHEFLSTNREDLISRCRLKVSQRDSPPATASELENGIPLILNQLYEALMHEQASPMRREESIRGDSPNTPAWIESGRTAGLHGAELFKLGYSLAQVVHDYGDLCQAITESAIENHASITVDEFHTFNRLLDNSIASAVSAFGVLQHSSSFSGGAQDIHDRLGTFGDSPLLAATPIPCASPPRSGDPLRPAPAPLPYRYPPQRPPTSLWQITRDRLILRAESIAIALKTAMRLAW